METNIFVMESEKSKSDLLRRRPRRKPKPPNWLVAPTFRTIVVREEQAEYVPDKRPSDRGE